MKQLVLTITASEWLNTEILETFPIWKYSKNVKFEYVVDEFEELYLRPVLKKFIDDWLILISNNNAMYKYARHTTSVTQSKDYKPDLESIISTTINPLNYA
jgi:hypothetical protein